MASGQKYILSDNPTEIERLSYNHRAIQAAFQKLVFAPVDTSQPGLRVIDSACADGLWLRELQKDITSISYSLVGADLTPSFFPTTSPPHTIFVEQSITQPWPQEMQAQFDLVHQRLVLPFCGAGKTPIQTCIDYLFQLARPGSGWVQLVEADHTIKDADGPVMRQVSSLVRQMLASIDTDLAYSHTMANALRQAGCVDVAEEIIDVPQGRTAATEELREFSRASLTMAVQSMVKLLAVRGCEGFTTEELEQVVPNLDKELREVGDYQRYHIVWGRRPK